MSKTLPIILQSELAECGLACLAMILNYHGYRITLSELRRKYKSTLKGMTLYQLKKIAQDLGLSIKVLRLDLDQLKSVQLPFIVHWDLNHFMVIKKIYEGLIEVHDPARGVRKISLSEVSCSFTGIVIEVSIQENFQIRTICKNFSTTLTTLFKKYHLTIYKLICFSCLIQLLYIGGIRIIQKCIDSSTTPLQYQSIAILLIAFLGIKLMEVCAISIRAFMISCVGATLSHEFGMSVMRHLLTLPIAFFENRHVGDIVSRFAAIEKIKTSVTEGLVEGLVDGLVSVITLIAMCINSLMLSVVVMVSSTLYLFSRFIYHRKIRQYHDEALYARSTELSHFMETIRAVPAIKIFSKENDRLAGWSNRFVRSLNAITRISWHKIFFDSGKNFLFAIDLLVTLALSCYLISKVNMTIGLLYAFMSFRQQFIMSVSSLVDKLHDYRLLKLHLDRLDDIISEPSELKSSHICSEHRQIKSRTLSVNNVTFAYCNEEKSVLDNLSFVIKPKECVVITGPSGCGKTTLLKIMMGLLRPSKGSLLLDECEIYPNHVACYRHSIASVMQDDVLLSGTIGQNISFFDQGQDLAHIMSCAERAGIIDEINTFPMKFDTLIGDMGSVLSGGQKQRILLARALYARPTILFLDEASSHLDNKKEREINHSIRSLGITVVMIAHRKETILMADRVISLSEDG